MDCPFSRDLPYLPVGVALGLAGEEKLAAVEGNLRVGGGEELLCQGGNRQMGAVPSASEAQTHKSAAERKPLRGIANV